MKLLIFNILLFTKIAFADISICHRDAETHLHGKTPLSPSTECESLIKSLKTRVEAQSMNGAIQVVGAKNMFYVSNPMGSILSAGDQTRLKDINYLRICDQNNYILVHQNLVSKEVISIFQKESIGNVSPIRYLEMPPASSITNIQISGYNKEIILTSKTNKNVKFFNPISDSRYRLEDLKYEVKKLRIIEGELTNLSSPLAAVHSPIKKQIYVLDSDRILVYPETANGDVAPVKILEAPGRSKTLYMKLNSDHSQISFSNGWEQFPSLKID